jgi:phage shock protein C
MLCKLFKKKGAAMPEKRLTKSTTNKMLAGVCGGIAEYLEVDATIVRAGFVILALMGGPGILLYIILALVLPSE